jgi:hypothetical protein
MQTKLFCQVVLIATTCASTTLAGNTVTERPLSAIDWLDSIPQSTPIKLATDEPKVINGAPLPGVTVTTLDGQTAQIIGLIPSTVSGLPTNLWGKSDAGMLAQTLANMPTLTLPAAQATLFTLLLAVADPASGKAAAFDMARVDALVKAGALDPALALIKQIGPSKNPAIAQRFADASLLNETETASCALINATPFLAPDFAYRIFCTARSGDWNTAALLFGIARILGTVTPNQAAVLERFLDPDLFEGDAPLPRPTTPSPLLFRMHEALGQPITTRSWPLAYANADLRDVAGWKTQIEAAERLAQSGALPANRLLGIYSQRSPAASGGIWDHVAAVQRFETALNTRSAAAIAKTMSTAWSLIQAANLSAPFATLFAGRVLKTELPPQIHDDALDIILYSSLYKSAAATFPDAADRHPFRTAVALGDVSAINADSPLKIAILRGFSSDSADPTLLQQAKNSELGHALLNTLTMLQSGSEGDMGQLSTALGTFRALGLEDMARRAALQILIEAPSR